MNDMERAFWRLKEDVNLELLYLVAVESGNWNPFNHYVQEVASKHGIPDANSICDMLREEFRGRYGHVQG